MRRRRRVESAAEVERVGSVERERIETAERKEAVMTRKAAVRLLGAVLLGCGCRGPGAWLGSARQQIGRAHV